MATQCCECTTAVTTDADGVQHAPTCLKLVTFDEGLSLNQLFILPAGFTAHEDLEISSGDGVNGTKCGEPTEPEAGYAMHLFTLPGDVPEVAGIYPVLTDTCGTKRREFGMGGFYDFSNMQVVGDELMEIRIHQAGQETLAALMIGDVDSWIAGDFDGGVDLFVIDLSGDVHYKLYNVIVPGTYRYIEWRGAVASESSEASNGVSNKDGWVEVRVDGVVYPSGSDFAYLSAHPDEIPPICAPVADLNFWTTNSAADTAYRGGWNKARWQPQGRFDCLYVREVAQYCEVPATTEEGRRPGDCAPPGPGGSTFDGAASGKRIVHPGGYRTAYVAPTYGGVPATASDPTDAQTLTGAVTPIVTSEITLCDASVKRYAMVRVNRAGAPSHQNRVLRYGPIPFRLSDRFGNLPSQTYEIEYADEDGELRALLATGDNRFYTRWEIHNYIESDVGRLAGTARRSLSRGRVIAPPVTSDQTVTLQIGDELTRQYGATSLDRALPWVRMRDVYKAGMTATGMIYLGGLPEELADQVLPILYSEASDDVKQQDTITPVGINLLRYAGRFKLLSGSQTWYGFAVCLYAIKDATGGGLFASNMHEDCPGSVRINPDKYTGEWLVPGKGNWATYFGTNYHDVTISGTTYRVTMIFGRGRVAQQHVDGIVPVSVNAWGIETVGDSSGTMISDGAYILQHMLDHPILRRTTSGNWGAVGTFADGVAKVRTSSFLAVKDLHDDRMTTGYRARFIMDKERPARDWLADAQISWDIRLYVNHHGQVCASTLDDAGSVAGLLTFTELLHIKENSFQILPERNGEVENVQPYQFGPEPATGRFAGSHTFKVNTAITNWGEERQADPLVYEGIYQAPMGIDVTSRRMLTTKDGILRGVYDIDHAGVDLTIGQLKRLTHASGFGQLGWTDRVLRAVGVIANPNEDAFDCTVEWEDVNDLLIPAAGFNPVGAEGDSSANLVGSEAAGTALRV